MNEKVALITGSGKRRVGNAIVRAFAERGYAVAVHYHDSAADARETVSQMRSGGSRAEAYRADVSKEDEVDGMFTEVERDFGRLDVLVTAAAIWQSKPLEEVTAEDVRRHFEINALGTFLCCQRAGLMMVKQREGGSIVTIGDWAIERPYPNYAAYFASKGRYRP